MPAALKHYEATVLNDDLCVESETRRVLAYTPEHARRMVASPTVTVLSVREVSAEERLRALGIDLSQEPPWDRDERMST